jgi:hypothetical protein
MKNGFRPASMVPSWAHCGSGVWPRARTRWNNSVSIKQMEASDSTIGICPIKKTDHVTRARFRLLLASYFISY